MPSLLAVGALRLRFGLGPICWSRSTLVTVTGVAGVEVPFLEGSINGVEEEGTKAVLVEVLLNGKDSRLRSCVSDGPRLVANQSLGFCCVLGTLSHRGRILFQDLGSDFRRE